MPMYTTLTFMTEMLLFVTYVQLFYATGKVTVMVYTALAYSYYVIFYDVLQL